MNWSDEGFLLSKNRYNENSLIVEIFTKEKGKVSGIIFGGTSKKIKNYLQIGNKLHVNYNSKNENRIGYFKVEILNAYSPLYFDDRQKLSCLTSAMNLIKILTADAQSNEKVFFIIQNFFLILQDKNWLKKYIFWELELLKILGYDLELDKKVKDIKQLGRFGNDNMKIIDATEPLHNHTASENKIGFGLTFSKLLKNYLNTEKNIILVPCGFGGTGFAQNNWNKGDELYADAVSRVRHVIENNPGSELTAILWHQGESDVGSMSYENDLDNFINDIRSDISAFDVPFILGGMVPFWVDESDQRIKQQEIISNTVNRHNLIGYANPELPFRIEKEDNFFDEIHFDAAGQRELGKRYFNEYLRLKSDDSLD